MQQVPACAILLDGQPVRGHEMAADHLTSPTAIYAHDVIALNGSPERHCWSSFDDGFGRRLAEVTQSLMDSRDQGRKLVGCNLVALQIGADDLHSEGRDWAMQSAIRRTFWFSMFGRQNTMPAEFRAVIKASP